jgi:hypothetical protein
MYLIAWMDQAAAFTTIGRARSTVVTASIDGIEFKVTIKQADIISGSHGIGRIFGLSKPNRESRRADSNRFPAPATSALLQMPRYAALSGKGA